MEQRRCILLFVVVIFIVLNLMMPTGNEGGKSDTLGHVGGAIVGLIWGMAFFPRTKTACGEKMRKIGLVLTALFFIGFTLLLFLNKG